MRIWGDVGRLEEELDAGEALGQLAPSRFTNSSVGRWPFFSDSRISPSSVPMIEHIESTSLNGISIIKVFFQPNDNIQTALAQVAAIGQTQLRQLPPGMSPPLVIKYSASSIPVVQLGLSSPTLPEQTGFDAAINIVRPQLVTIPGVAIPFSYGRSRWW